MATMNVSLPDSMKSFVDEQVGRLGYSSSSEYIRDLIRRRQEELTRFDALIRAGLESSTTPAELSLFTAELRDRIANGGS